MSVTGVTTAERLAVRVNDSETVRPHFVSCRPALQTSSGSLSSLGGPLTKRSGRSR